MRRFARENGLSLVFGGLFLLALLGQSFAGWREYCSQLVSDGVPTIGYWHYLVSPDFAVDVAENWQSEFLQFFLYVFLTVWLVQKGSPESKELGTEGPGSDEDELVQEHAKPDSPRFARAKGVVGFLYAHSLCTAFAVLFLASWAVQAVAGWAAFAHEELRQQETPPTFLHYLVMPDFWSRSLQNWQSELLAVGSFAVFSIWLRQNGSPESKPVGAPHTQTG